MWNTLQKLFLGSPVRKASESAQPYGLMWLLLLKQVEASSVGSCLLPDIPSSMTALLFTQGTRVTYVTYAPLPVTDSEDFLSVPSGFQLSA